jgi:hypothetical protein
MSMEPADGVTVMMAGTGVDGGVLLPPHPLSASINGKVMTTSHTSPDLPNESSPSRPAWTAKCLLETVSVEAHNFFSKLSCSASPTRRRKIPIATSHFAMLAGIALW